MGIQLFIPTISKHAPQCYGRFSLDKLAGTVVAIDATLMVYRFCMARTITKTINNSEDICNLDENGSFRHVQFTFDLIEYLEHIGAKPIFVFDGYQASDAKKQVAHVSRQARRIRTERMANTAQDSADQITKYLSKLSLEESTELDTCDRIIPDPIPVDHQPVYKMSMDKVQSSHQSISGIRASNVTLDSNFFTQNAFYAVTDKIRRQSLNTTSKQAPSQPCSTKIDELIKSSLPVTSEDTLPFHENSSTSTPLRLANIPYSRSPIYDSSLCDTLPELLDVPTRPTPTLKSLMDRAPSKSTPIIANSVKDSNFFDSSAFSTNDYIAHNNPFDYLTEYQLSGSASDWNSESEDERTYLLSRRTNSQSNGDRRHHRSNRRRSSHNSNDSTRLESLHGDEQPVPIPTQANLNSQNIDDDDDIPLSQLVNAPSTLESAIGSNKSLALS